MDSDSGIMSPKPCNERLVYTFSEKSGHMICCECKYETSSFTEICNHFIKQHDVTNLQGKFQCPHCSYMDLDQIVVKTHVSKCAKKLYSRVKSRQISQSEHEQQQGKESVTKCSDNTKKPDSGVTAVVKPYKCDICKKYFAQKRILMNHIKQFHLRNHTSQFPCGICSAKFLQQHSLSVHWSVAHHVTRDDPDKPIVKKQMYLKHLKCSNCSFYTFQKTRFEKHLLRCRSKRVVCLICKKKFRSKRDMASHMKHQHSETRSVNSEITNNSGKQGGKEDRLGTCLEKDYPHNPGCSEKAQSNYSNQVPDDKTISEKLKEIDEVISYRIHSGESFSESDIDQFINSGFLLFYLEGKGTFRCFFCEKECVSPLTVRSHFKMSHLSLLQCRECSFVCREFHLFKCHCIAEHSAYISQCMKETYICELCGSTFYKKSALANHMNLEHDKVEDVSDKEIRPCYCSYCGRKFVTKSRLINHERYIHCSDEDKIKCTICDFKTGLKQHFERHMRKHTGEKPYACLRCDRRFSQKTSMWRHYRTHTKEQIFSCPVCDQKFSQRCSMNRHVLTHDKIKPFQCGVCEAFYSQLFPLKNHLKKKHPDVDMEENIVRIKQPITVSGT